MSVAVWAVGVTADRGTAGPLKPPFDVAKRRAMLGTRVEGFSCLPPPPPVRDLDFSGFYADSGRGSSVVDPGAKNAYDRATHPITQYENTITQMSDLYVHSNPPKGAVAACVLDWLHAWARHEAMLGRATQQGGFIRKWGLAPVSASYLKVRDDASLDSTKKRVVELWIGHWVSVVRSDYSNGIDRTSRRNNHLYWAAWSVMLAAVILDDPSLHDWAVDSYRFAVTQIQPDGTLPLELARKSKALHYHLFSIAPLVLIAETADRNGADLYGLGSGGLHRLVRRAVAGLDDPAYFRRLTGAEQDWVGELDGSMLAWMEPYYARFRDLALEKWIGRFRPMKNRRLGGDTTLLFGLRDLPGR